jgi:hypothetical protein
MDSPYIYSEFTGLCFSLKMMDGWGDQAYSKSDNLRNFVKHFAHKKMFTKLCKTLNKMYVPDGSKLSCGSIGKQSIKPEVAGRQA